MSSATPYSFILFIHNLFRWLVLIAAAWSLFRAWSGWLGKRAWANADRLAGLFFSIAIDVQLALGLVLLFVSPLAKSFFMDSAAAMKVSDIRFFAVEHVPLMVVSAVIIHVANAIASRAQGDIEKFRLAAIGQALAVLLILVAIPWWRPLLRSVGF
jgi:hypothetical protein